MEQIYFIRILLSNVEFSVSIISQEISVWNSPLSRHNVFALGLIRTDVMHGPENMAEQPGKSGEI
jgi:hypothetical protein